jgi:lipopolysaccharide transport system ATP-binding protein
MPLPALKAEGLSKRYRLGARETLNRTLGETLMAMVRRFNPLSNGQNTQQDQADTEFWALNDVSFTIQSGEIVGIIGRNGAGKSTLLKVLARITEPTRGHAEVYGRLGSLLEVGTGFHPDLTGRENIYLNGSILGMARREIEHKFDEIVAFAELERFLDTPVKHYSSGMYVRLAFAVAAHLEPEILLVDEVLAVGDAAFQKKCLGKMSEVAQDGRTVLFVSHNTAALLGFCQRGILLEHGKVVADDKIEAVIQRYLSNLRVTTPWDLSGYRERQGAGRVRFTAAIFEDVQGNPLEQGISGNPLVVKLKYQSAGNGHAQPLRNCRAAVTFFDMLGQPLFNCSSELVIQNPITLAPHGELRCVIPRLPLSRGQYLLTLFLQVNREIEDWIENAIELEVIDGDFYGTGRLYPPGWNGKGVLVPYQWQVESENSRQ